MKLWDTHKGWPWKLLGVYICFSYLVPLLKHADVYLFLYLFNVLRGLYLILSLGSHFLSLCFKCLSLFFFSTHTCSSLTSLRVFAFRILPKKNIILLFWPLVLDLEIHRVHVIHKTSIWFVYLKKKDGAQNNQMTNWACSRKKEQSLIKWSCSLQEWAGEELPCSKLWSKFL